MLARFMEKHGIPKKASDWTDDVFRALRKPLGFEAAISILFTAEIIGLVYYRALREATGSRLLRAICNKILEDEKSHLEYESVLIRSAQDARGSWARRAWRAAHMWSSASTARCCGGAAGPSSISSRIAGRSSTGCFLRPSREPGRLAWPHGGKRMSWPIRHHRFDGAVLSVAVEPRVHGPPGTTATAATFLPRNSNAWAKARRMAGDLTRS
jgi:hypothetical protein